MADLTVKFKEPIKTRVKCRFHWLKDCKNTAKSGKREGYLKEGVAYISINGWAAGGSTTLVICEGCADKFFDQVTQAKKELRGYRNKVFNAKTSECGE